MENVTNQLTFRDCISVGLLIGANNIIMMMIIIIIIIVIIIIMMIIIIIIIIIQSLFNVGHIHLQNIQANKNQRWNTIDITITMVFAHNK